MIEEKERERGREKERESKCVCVCMYVNISFNVCQILINHVSRYHVIFIINKHWILNIIMLYLFFEKSLKA